MKSPVIRIFFMLYFTLPDYLPFCYGQENTLLWTQTSAIWSSIRGIHGNLDDYAKMDKSYTNIRSTSIKNADKIGIAHDHIRDQVCWSDNSIHGIYCQAYQDMLNRSLETHRTVVKDNLDIRDIDIDWETGNIYFATTNSIAVAPSSEDSGNVYKHLLTKNLNGVSGIAVDTVNNLLFWTNQQKGSIERSTLSGRDRRLLASSSDGQPIGITVVPEEERVYWVDKKYGAIKGCNYTGGDPQTYTNRRTTESSLYGIAIQSDIAFVTDTAELTMDVYSMKSDSSFEFAFAREIDAIPHHITVAVRPDGDPTHECDTKGCKHICLNMGGGTGRCTCKDGYLLGPDGLSCTERHPQYVYTTGDAVLLASVVVNPAKPSRLTLEEKRLLGDRDDVRPLGYHYRENTLFIGEANSGVILRGDPNAATQRYTEHTVNTKQIQGIAIDWLASNVYWTDKDLGLIMVSRTDGRYHSVLVPRAGEPTGIAVDAKNRYLFWSDATDQNEAIWSAHLDGTGAKTIADDREIDHPQGLFLDPHTERLYWVDKNRGSIQGMDYEGHNRINVIGQDGGYYYDVTMFQDITTLTDVDQGLSFRSSLTGEKFDLDGSVARRAFDVITYDPYLQPTENSRCQVYNGGCSQLCYLSGDSDNTCGCAIGFKLNADGRSCDSDNTHEHFVLYTDPYHKQVYQTSLSDTTLTTQGIPGPLMDYPISADYDTGKGRVFWIDQSRGEFRRTTVADGAEDAIRTFAAGSAPQRLVVDPVNGWVYYTDSGRGTVSKMMVDGSEHSDMFTGLDRPYGIALDYENKTLAWTTNSSVEVCNTDGTGRRAIQQGLVQAGGVDILPKSQVVYFSDNRTGTIYSFDLSTNKIKVLYEDNNYRIHSLAVTAEHIYFTTHNDKGVYRIDRTNGGGFTTVGEPVFARVTDIKVVRGTVVPVYSEGDGFNWIILAGALAGFLLFLIILLAAICGTRKRRRKTQQASRTAGDAEGSHGINDVDQSYTYVNQAHLFDIRGSHEAMNSNGHVNGNANGHGTNGKANGDQTTGFDAVNDASMGEYVGLGDIATMDRARASSREEHNGAFDMAAVAAVTAAASPKRNYSHDEVEEINRKYKPKRTFGRKKKTMPRDPDFEFAGGDKVATRIQRLANRLRNRLSSVRWSSGDKTDGESTDPAPEEAPNPQIVDPSRSDPLPKARKVTGPPVLHQMPRGFAPASHCVPQHVKGK